MGANDIESEGLAKLLADVQRTIRENEQFILYLKDEAVDADLQETGAPTEGRSDSVDSADEGGYEEL